MRFIFNFLKKSFFWLYPRTSWQWDVLCVLILVFIFLTPKSWFQNTQFQHNRMEGGIQQVLIAATDVAGTPADKADIERRVRQVTGRPDAQITRVSEKRDPAGALIGYEVDIHY